jgi:hypothetical protein
MIVRRYIKNAHNRKKNQKSTFRLILRACHKSGTWNPPTTMRSRPALISQLTFPSSPIWQCVPCCVSVYMSCATHNHRFLTQKGNAIRGFTCIITPCQVSFHEYSLFPNFSLKVIFDDVLILRLIECAA